LKRHIEKVGDFIIFYKVIDIKSIIGCWREEKLKFRLYIYIYMIALDIM